MIYVSSMIKEFMLAKVIDNDETSVNYSPRLPANKPLGPEKGMMGGAQLWGTNIMFG